LQQLWCTLLVAQRSIHWIRNFYFCAKTFFKTKLLLSLAIKHFNLNLLQIIITQKALQPINLFFIFYLFYRFFDFIMINISQVHGVQRKTKNFLSGSKLMDLKNGPCAQKLSLEGVENNVVNAGLITSTRTWKRVIGRQRKMKSFSKVTWKWVVPGVA